MNKLVVFLVLVAGIARADDLKTKKGQDVQEAPPVRTTAPVARSSGVRYPAYTNGAAAQQRLYRQYQLPSQGGRAQGKISAQTQNSGLPSQLTHWRARHADGNGNSVPASNGVEKSAQNNSTNRGGRRNDADAKVVPAANANVAGFRKRGTPVVNFTNNSNVSFADACRRDHHHPHDRDWWRNHCPVIILIGGGYFAWDNGWWYPAFGYDSYYASYSYSNPVYGYDGLPPDQVIANVQGALQELGYFPYAVDGVLGPVTQQAIADFQRDQGIYTTGAIDQPTLQALGFID